MTEDLNDLYLLSDMAFLEYSFRNANNIRKKYESEGYKVILRTKGDNYKVFIFNE